MSLLFRFYFFILHIRVGGFATFCANPGIRIYIMLYVDQKIKQTYSFSPLIFKEHIHLLISLENSLMSKTCQHLSPCMSFYNCLFLSVSDSECFYPH